MDLPDLVLGETCGVVFSLVRRTQLALDSAGLKQALEAVTERELRRAAEELLPRRGTRRCSYRRKNDAPTPRAARTAAADRSGHDLERIRPGERAAL
jgi:hypothetical protein